MLNVSEIIDLIQKDSSSTSKRNANVGQRYYDGVHDIRDFRMFYFNEQGELVEDKIRSNSRISHPFFTELVDQQVQYMLSGGQFLHARKGKEELQKYLDEYFDDDFVSELSDCMTGAISKGFDYLHAYKGKDDKVHFEYCDSLGVVEVRENESSDKCQYIIYYYIDRVTKDGKQVKHIEVSDESQTWFYVQVGNEEVVIDPDVEINPRPHYLYTKDKSGAKYWKPLGYIPFFRLDNNKKQTSSLSPIKDLIDDYDLMSCGLSNNLKDFDTPLHVVKGFQGDNLDELSVNLKTKKMIGVDSEGDVEIRTVEIPYQARETKLKLDEVNIYRFGMGFNSNQVGDGNITNIVIKSRYALLDLKCDKFEKRLKKFMTKILKIVLQEINDQNETDYSISDVDIIFDREIMTNASDNSQIELTDAQTKQIETNMLLSLVNVFGNELIIQRICEVLDIDYEEIKDKLPKDPEEELDEVDDVLSGVIPDEQKTE